MKEIFEGSVKGPGVGKTTFQGNIGNLFLGIGEERDCLVQPVGGKIMIKGCIGGILEGMGEVIFRHAAKGRDIPKGYLLSIMKGNIGVYFLKKRNVKKPLLFCFCGQLNQLSGAKQCTQKQLGKTVCHIPVAPFFCACFINQLKDQGFQLIVQCRILFDGIALHAECGKISLLYRILAVQFDNMQTVGSLRSKAVYLTGHKDADITFRCSKARIVTCNVDCTGLHQNDFHFRMNVRNIIEVFGVQDNMREIQHCIVDGFKKSH